MMAGKALAGLKAGIAANARRAGTMCSMVDPALHREEHARIEAVLKAAEENVAIFDDSTVGFIEDMLDRLDKWGPGLRVSTKQLVWLSSIEAELQLNDVKIGEGEE